MNRFSSLRAAKAAIREDVLVTKPGTKPPGVSIQDHRCAGATPIVAAITFDEVATLSTTIE